LEPALPKSRLSSKKKKKKGEGGEVGHSSGRLQRSPVYQGVSFKKGEKKGTLGGWKRRGLREGNILCGKKSAKKRKKKKKKDVLGI